MPPRYRGAANAALLLVLSLVCGFFAAGINGWYEERDFHCFYVAGRIVATGGDPYDVAQFRPAVVAIPPSPAFALARCGQRLSYPPWTAVAFAPFGALPLPAAATLWATLSVVAVVLGISWTRQLIGPRHIGWPLVAVLVIGTEPFVRNLLEGQFAAFSFAFTASAVLSFRSLRDAQAGIATAALSIKPHPSVGFATALLGLALVRRRWRLLGSAAASGLAFAGLIQLVRPGWLLEFFTAVTDLSGSVGDRATIWNLAGSGPLAIALIALLLSAVVVLVRGRRLTDNDVLGLGVALSLVAAPYAWSHDFVVLAIPWSMTLAYAMQLRPSRRRALTFSTVIVAAPLLWILAATMQARQSESLSVIVPIVSALLLALAIRWGGARVV